jgi:shikimate kinase
MGVGKSSVGKLLALKINYLFIDIDKEIVKEQRKSINEIFNIHGEKDFRKIEKKKIKEIANFDKQVIACGGGAVIDPENVAILKNNSILIHLTAKPEEILHRLEKDNTRPLLQKGNKIENIKMLLNERYVIYNKIADLSVKTDDKTPEAITLEIIEKVSKII